MAPTRPAREPARSGPCLARRRGLLLAAVGTAVFPSTPRRTNASEPEPVRITGTGAALGAMRMLAQAFAQERPGARILVLRSLGSTGGIRALLGGAVEVAVATRPLSAEERAAGLIDAPYGRTPHVLATHIATAVPPEGLMLRDVARIFAGELPAWPDGAPVRVVRRPLSDAGAQLLRRWSPEMPRALEALERRPGLFTAATDQDNADALEALRGSFGAMALGQILAEQRRLQPLRLDGVAPSAAALAAGLYRFEMVLHMATQAAPRPEVEAFVAFVRSAAGHAVLARTGHLAPQGAEAA